VAIHRCLDYHVVLLLTIIIRIGMLSYVIVFCVDIYYYYYYYTTTTTSTSIMMAGGGAQAGAKELTHAVPTAIADRSL
jgi:hypothetical protein